MDYTNCEFSEPVSWDNEAEILIPADSELKPEKTWNFQKMTCETDLGTLETLELIENATTGASFYVSKQIDYGDILVITFLTLFLVFGIFKFLVNFIIPRFITYFKR